MTAWSSVRRILRPNLVTTREGHAGYMTMCQNVLNSLSMNLCEFERGVGVMVIVTVVVQCMSGRERMCMSECV